MITIMAKNNYKTLTKKEIRIVRTHSVAFILTL